MIPLALSLLLCVTARGCAIGVLPLLPHGPRLAAWLAPALPPLGGLLPARGAH